MKPLNVRFSDDIKEKIASFAKENRLTGSDVARACLNQGFKSISGYNETMKELGLYNEQDRFERIAQEVKRSQ